MLFVQRAQVVPMRELKDELASLSIDREAPRRGRWRAPLVVLVLIGVAVVAGFYYVRSNPVFGAVEVEAVQPRVESASEANAHRVRLPGGAQAVGGFVEDSGPHLEAAG